MSGRNWKEKIEELEKKVEEERKYAHEAEDLLTEALQSKVNKEFTII